MIERLIPPYWLQRLGCAQDPKPLNDLLASLQEKVAKGGGRLSVRCFHKEDILMLILRFRDSDPDDISLRLCCYVDQDPQTMIAAQLYDDPVIERRVKAADAELMLFCQTYVPRLPVPIRAPRKARTGAKQ